MKRYNSSELNPFAEQEAIKVLKNINEIFNQILLELISKCESLSLGKYLEKSKIFFIWL